LKCLEFLEGEILGNLSPPSETAAIFTEIIQSDSGEVVAPENYFPALREVCNKHGIWLIVDEIKTGLGRTGRLFAFEKYGIVPDGIALAKPLGGGLPISAVVARSEIFDADLYTAYTLGGSPVACTSALALLDVIQEEGLVENAAEMGAYLMSSLRELMQDHPVIGEVRGEGLLVGVELHHVEDSEENLSDNAARLAYRCFELGLILLSFGSVIEMTPPLTITKSEIDQGVDIFRQAIETI
jgi:4-aminobutyrate aminotransferase